jgi:hypothetical protein
MSEAHDHIRYLYAFELWNERNAAVKALKEMGLLALDPLFEVAKGTYPTPDLSRLKPQALLWNVYWRITRLFNPEGQIMNARSTAIDLIGEIGGAAVVEPLMAWFETEPDERIRPYIRAELIRIGDRRALELFLADTDIRKGHLPLQLIDLFSEWRDPRTVEPLVAAMRTGHLLSRYTEICVAALGKIGGERAADVLLKHLIEIIKLPPEKWDDSESNLGTLDWEVATYHATRTSLNTVLKAIRMIDDPQVQKRLNKILLKIPYYVLPHIKW